MNYLDPTEVPFRMGRTALALMGALAFLAAGLFVLLGGDPVVDAQRSGAEALLDNTMGWLGIAALLAFIGFLGYRLVRRRHGLVLHAGGLVDQDSALAVGHVPWTDITGFFIRTVEGEAFLVVHVRDPSIYIERGNPVLRRLRALSTQACGSPVSVSGKWLRADLQELLALCQDYHRRYGAPTAS